MKNRKWIKMLSVLILIIISFFAWQKYKKRNNKENYRKVTVERGLIRVTVQATGTTMPQNRLELKPPISGRIESIEVQEGDKVKKGQVLAWLSSTDRAALLDAARFKGTGELSYWENAYKPTPLVSPMGGEIIARNMEPGQTVTTADAPLVMSDRLIVKAQVDETDIGQIKLGQKVKVTLDAYPNIDIPGVVDHVAYESKTVNNVTIYEVDVLPQKVPPFMRSGMTSNLVFTVKEKEDLLLLPEEAIQNVRGESRVLIPSSDESKKGKRETKIIQTGLSDGKNIEVADGLSEGDVVLVPEIKLDSSNSKSSGTNPFMPSRGRPGSSARSGGGSGR